MTRLRDPDCGGVRLVRRVRRRDCGAVGLARGCGRMIAEPSGVLAEREASFTEP